MGASAARVLEQIPKPNPDRTIEDCGCERFTKDGRVRLWRCTLHEQEHQAAEHHRRVERERREREANATSLLQRAGFLREHADAELAHFDPGIQGQALAWINDPRPRRGLLIKGPVGTGKSHLAAAISRSFAIEGDEVRALLAGDLFSEIRASFRDEAGDSERVLVERLKSGDLLVIDDLGNEGTITPFVVSILHRVFSTRNGNYDPTIVTTNLTEVDLGRIYGEAIASRLSCWAAIVVEGEDRRPLR